jgi:hypothetical protein
MTRTMPETTPVTEMGIEPLVTELRRCAEVFHQHIVATACLQAADCIEALSTRTPEAVQVDADKDAPLNMCAHGADRGSYCGYCGGYSKGVQSA